MLNFLINFLVKIENWFKRKTFTQLIREYYLIERTKISKFKGIDDEFNKKIVHYKEGEKLEKYPYIKSIVTRLKEDFPVRDKENLEEDEEFIWEEPTEFGVVKEIR